MSSAVRAVPLALMRSLKPKRRRRAASTVRSSGQSPIDIAPRMPADFQHVLEACRGDQRSDWQIAGQHSIGGYGGAMDQQGDVIEREAMAAGRRGDGIEQADRRVFRRCRHLVAEDRAVVLVEAFEIGEGAADVDSDPDASGLHRPVRSRCCGGHQG